MPVDHQNDDQEIYRLGGNIDTEIAYVHIRDRLQFENMGGPFPERGNNFSDFKRVLDLPCRTGVWASSVAHANPRIEVIGLERQKRGVECAERLGKSQELNNLRFALIGDDVTHLGFPDDYFDLINASYLFSVVLAHQWPAFLKECLRITRPGGYIRVMGAEWGMTNSLAVEQFSGLFLQGMKRAGLSLSVDGRHMGIVIVLGRLLKEAGWGEIERRAYVDDYQTGPSVPADPTTRAELMANPLRQTILNQKLATPEEVEALLHEAANDFAREDFCGLFFLLSFCARKPG